MIAKGKLDWAEAKRPRHRSTALPRGEVIAAVLWPCIPGASFVVGVARAVDGASELSDIAIATRDGHTSARRESRGTRSGGGRSAAA
jgi:hypothetical protein